MPSSAARASAHGDEEDGGDEDVNEGAAVYDLMWWAYGKGPVEPDQPVRRSSARSIQDEEMLSQVDDDSSDASSSDEDMSSDSEPGMQAASSVTCNRVTSVENSQMRLTLDLLGQGCITLPGCTNMFYAISVLQTQMHRVQLLWYSWWPARTNIMQ